jgi:predicted nucleotidyltransferase component of viral defense system
VKARPPKDLSASIRQLLLNLAKARGEDFTFVLLRYGLERLLYRLGQSRHAGRFILKGAMLFPLWSGNLHRATKDMDLLGHGPRDLDGLQATFREIVSATADDGLLFLPETIRVAEIRENAVYDGVRVTLEARLGAARLALQVDVGFGDAVTPAPQEADYPTLLEMPAPRLRVYPREAVIGEKLHAMIDLGLGNSRMKDFFDIWFLSNNFEFDGSVLAQAVRATFDRRDTAVPLELPVALTPIFAADRGKQTQWSAFINRARPASSPVDLADVVDRLRKFLEPVLVAAREPAKATAARWSPGRGWSDGT